MVGKPSPSSPQSRQLTSQPDPLTVITSETPPRHFQHDARRHHNRDNQYAATPPSRTSTADRTETESRAASGAGTGATTGAVLGGGAGLLAGLGMLAIPGVG